MKYTIRRRKKLTRTPAILRKILHARRAHFPDLKAAAAVIKLLDESERGHEKAHRFGGKLVDSEFRRAKTDARVLVDLHAQAHNLIALGSELLRVCELWRGRRDMSEKVWLIEEPSKPMKLAIAADLGRNLAVRSANTVVIAPIEVSDQEELVAHLTKSAFEH